MQDRVTNDDSPALMCTLLRAGVGDLTFESTVIPEVINFRFE